MELKKPMLEKEDIDKLKMLRSILLNGEFKLKGDAIKTVSQIIGWVDLLEVKIENELKKGKKKPTVKDIK